MKCKLVKLLKFNGNKASVYSIFIDNEQETLFDKFLKENVYSFTSEIKNILMRLNTIGQKTGARIDFFKEFEGRSRDGVLIDEIGGTNQIEELYKSNFDIYNKNSKLFLLESKDNQLKIYKKSRQGLNLTSEDNDKFFLNAPYNYFTFPIISELK